VASRTEVVFMASGAETPSRDFKRGKRAMLSERTTPSQEAMALSMTGLSRTDDDLCYL